MHPRVSVFEAPQWVTYFRHKSTRNNIGEVLIRSLLTETLLTIVV